MADGGRGQWRRMKHNADEMKTDTLNQLNNIRTTNFLPIPRCPMTSLIGERSQRVLVLKMILNVFPFFPLLKFYDFPKLAKHLPPPSLHLIFKQKETRPRSDQKLPSWHMRHPQFSIRKNVNYVLDFTGPMALVHLIISFKYCTSILYSQV